MLEHTYLTFKMAHFAEVANMNISLGKKKLSELTRYYERSLADACKGFKLEVNEAGTWALSCSWLFRL